MSNFIEELIDIVTESELISGVGVVGVVGVTISSGSMFVLVPQLNNVKLKATQKMINSLVFISSNVLRLILREF